MKLRLQKDDGGIVAIFTIFVSTFVIISLFMMVFDVGSLYSERRTVQNGADSAVLAVTNECAIGGSGAINGSSSAYPTEICATRNYALDFATKYSNLNAPDGLTNVSEICGTQSLGSCSPLTNGQFECKSINPAYVNFARVKTSTKQITGNSISSLFASIVNPDNSNTTVLGCAQAAWGKAAFAPIYVPFALPICNYTLSGNQLIQDFNSNDPVVTGGCSITDLNGQIFNYTSPTKGFSLLDSFGCPGLTDPKSIRVGDLLNIQSSLTQVEQGCTGGQTQFYNQIDTLLGKILFLPVVTNVKCQSGSNNCQGNYQFNVASFFSFKFLGYKFKNRGSGGTSPSGGWPTDCDSTRNCVNGTFVRAIVPSADVSLDPNFPAVGAMAVQLLA